MSTPLATFFTKIGFDIDSASLKKLESQLNKLRTQVEKTAAKQYAEMRQLANFENREHNLRRNNLRQLANYENREFNLRTRRAAREAAAEARRLQEWFRQREREQRVESRNAQARDAQRRRLERSAEAARLRTARETSRQAAREMRDARQLADFQNREFNLRQRNLDRAARQRQRELQRERADTNRLHSEANRENRRRSSERLRQMRTEADFLNREFNLNRRNQERERLRAERERQRQERITNRPTPPSRNASGGIAGMGVNAQTAISSIAAGGFAQSAYQVANFSMARRPQYEFLTGSAEEAQKQIAFVDKEVERLSLNLMDANEQYKRLLASGATSIGVEKTQQLFTNFSNLSTMLGLSADAQKRGTNAFGQMLS